MKLPTCGGCAHFKPFYGSPRGFCRYPVAVAAAVGEVAQPVVVNGSDGACERIQERHVPR